VPFVGATDTRKESLYGGDELSFGRGGGLHPSVSHSRPIFTNSRDLDSETAIRDPPAWSYGQKRLGNVLHRQWNVFRDSARPYR